MARRDHFLVLRDRGALPRDVIRLAHIVDNAVGRKERARVDSERRSHARSDEMQQRTHRSPSKRARGQRKRERRDHSSDGEHRLVENGGDDQAADASAHHCQQRSRVEHRRRDSQERSQARRDDVVQDVHVAPGLRCRVVVREERIAKLASVYMAFDMPGDYSSRGMSGCTLALALAVAFDAFVIEPSRNER